jgi:protein transport protein SEC20
MNGRDLSSRLKALSEGYRGVVSLTNKLSKLSPQPGAATEEADPRVELSTEIHQSLKELEEEFELVRQDAEDTIGTEPRGAASRRRDSEKDNQRIALATQVERLGEDLRM